MKQWASNVGFTLVEILVVLLIIGITLGFALLSFGDFGEKRRIIVAAEQLTNYVKLVQHQAILDSNTFRINVTKDGYEALRFQPPATWSSITPKHMFHPQTFPPGLIVQIIKANKKSDSSAIIIHASGEISAFHFVFGSTKNDAIAAVIGDGSGAISMQILKQP